MSDPIKTITFISVAILCAIGVFLNMPTLNELEEGDPTGKMLLPKFTDPLAVTSLSITKYNEKTGNVVPFKVAMVDGVWQITSHENYPADAAEHLAKAASLLSKLKILGLASEEAGSQEAYGVIDPTDKNLGAGVTGVGMRVVLKDAKDNTLADVIIGEVDPAQPDIRYVRRTNQEMVFSVKLQTEVFSTKFNDWIEKDLLKMNVLDIRDIFIEDYNLDVVRGVQSPNGKLAVRYDPMAEGDKWILLENLDFDRTGGGWVSRPLESHEMLNADLLQQMKTALEDLKIVDVVRKPAGLSAELVAEKTLIDDEEAVKSLALHGFYMAEVGGQKGIYSNEGEIGILMNDGVEYVLRFGSIALNSRAAANSEADGDQKGSEADKDTDASGMNRYLLVTARFNLATIPRPKLEPLPPLPEEGAETPAAEDGSEKEKPADAADAEPTLEEVKAKREQIERDNQWKQDEYNEKVAAGQKRVEELNARFADWYYVISENVFKKLHLTQKELIKIRQPEANGTSAPGSNPLSPLSPGLLQHLQKGIDK
ncbi:MAG: DUF4340 domain-containing protein [Planctomycetia bacterium]|jgi:hypothetical protein